MILLVGIPFGANSSFLQGHSFSPHHIRFMVTEGSTNRYTERSLEVIESAVYRDCGDIVFQKN